MLLFMDGFDHYTSQADMLLKGWVLPDGRGVGTGPSGRFGRCMLFAGGGGGYAPYAELLVPNSSRLLNGFAYMAPQGGVPFVRFYDGATAQVYLAFDGSWKLTAYSGASSWATTFTYAPSTWIYAELRVDFGTGTSGRIVVKVNGQTVLDQASINTAPSGVARGNMVQYYQNGGNNQSASYDDLYLCDGTGTANNDFLGDCRVETLLPSGAGAETQWTPSAGANYTNVDEVPADGDTTYNKSNTVGQVDTYALPDLASVTGLIYGVQYLQSVRKDNAGTRLVAPVARIGGADYPGSDTGLGNSYVYTREIKEKSPATAAAWTISEINAMEYGVKVTG